MQTANDGAVKHVGSAVSSVSARDGDQTSGTMR
jgi:hypothetical protein